MATNPTAFRGGLSLSDLMQRLRMDQRPQVATGFDLQDFLAKLDQAAVPLNRTAMSMGAVPPPQPTDSPTLPTEATGGPEAAPKSSAAPYKPSGWAVLDRVLGGDTITQARRNLVKERNADEAAKSQTETLQAALAGITDPRERIAFLLNPTEYGKSLSSRYGAQNVTGGNTVVYGEGGPTYTAPKVEMSGDSGVVLTPDQMTVLGQRPASQAEKTELAKLQEAIRKNNMSDAVARGRLGVAQGQLGVSVGRLGLAKQKQPAASGAPSPVMSAIEAELRKRGKLK